MIIRDYRGKKLVQYLKPGMKVCVKFVHGLGDTVGFIPLFEKLKKLYPQVNFSLHTELGQEELFGEVSDNENDYDIVFVLNFPCSEISNDSNPKITKVGKCAKEEIGIDWSSSDEDLWKLNNYKSPLIAVHFNSTCLPSVVGCNESFSKQVWEHIRDAGLIPIETHFLHCNANLQNKKYSFIDNNVRSYRCNIANLIGLLQHCSGFVGVGSGNFHCAAQLYYNKCLYIKTAYDVKCYYQHENILSMDCHKPFDQGIWNEWLNRIKNI